MTHIIIIINMSCFNESTCVFTDLYHRVNCNYTFLQYVHVCNTTNTCQRFDELYDCCTDDIRHCTILYLDVGLIPTAIPTSTASSYMNAINICEYACQTELSASNDCHWYEMPYTDNFCYDYDNRYCCEGSHTNCCYLSTIYHVVIYCSIGMMLSCCLYYKYVSAKYNRVVPDKTTQPSQIPEKNDNVIMV